MLKLINFETYKFWKLTNVENRQKFRNLTDANLNVATL